MATLRQSEVLEILRKHETGIDELSIIPLIDLGGPLKHTLNNLDRGFIPKTYHWSREKTERAYAYKGYGEWGRSIIVAAKYYLTDEKLPIETSARSNAPFGLIARYTWRNNYRYLADRLFELVQKMEKILGRKIRHRALSNYTSLPEKVLFASSGLADFGKNSLLIHRKMGSYFVIGEAITDLEVEFESGVTPKKPDFSVCGTCMRCMEACPTGAIVEEGTIDVNRCFQYLSENLLPIPREYQGLWDNRLYGCSSCLDVCPHNSGLLPWGERHDTGRVGPGMYLLRVLALSDEEWGHTFARNQIGMRNRLGIVQNAIIALGNSGCSKALETLEPYLNHESPIIRASSAWTIGMMNTKRGRMMLQRRLSREEDPLVRGEIELSLRGIK